MTNAELSLHVKNLIFQGLKEPQQPASVHDVKPADFLNSGQSIWKYRDGLVFRLEMESEKQGDDLRQVVKPTDYAWSPAKGIMVLLWNNADLSKMIMEARMRGMQPDPERD
jgi:hypothetical protein